MSENRFTTGTSASTSSITAAEILKVAEELSVFMEKHKLVVVLFSPFLEDQILHGEAIDIMLRCDKNEKGYLVPEKFREIFERNYPGFHKPYKVRTPMDLRFMGILSVKSYI